MTDLMICAVALMILAAIFFLGGREVLGELLCKAFPKDYLQKGDVMYIYLNGIYNRKATVTNIGTCHVEIYDTLNLPLTYRGRFYGYGIEPSGDRFVYVRDRHLHKWVRLAQLMAVLFAIIDEEENMAQTTTATEEVVETEKESDDEL